VPQDVRPPVPLDDTDRALLQALVEDGRTANNALAARVGIAASTCLARVRNLRATGVLRGVHAEVDLAAVGRGVQALISVRLRANVRDHVDAFRETALELPGVLSVFHLAGSDDYLLHVAVPDSSALRDVLRDRLSAHPAVLSTQTHLVLDHVRANVPAAPGQRAGRPGRGSPAGAG
jgi:DNA-binding Lrp family transcriptional regulator